MLATVELEQCVEVDALDIDGTVIKVKVNASPFSRDGNVRPHVQLQRLIGESLFLKKCVLLHQTGTVGGKEEEEEERKKRFKRMEEGKKRIKLKKEKTKRGERERDKVHACIARQT